MRIGVALFALLQVVLLIGCGMIAGRSVEESPTPVDSGTDLGILDSCSSATALTNHQNRTSTLYEYQVEGTPICGRYSRESSIQGNLYVVGSDTLSSRQSYEIPKIQSWPTESAVKSNLLQSGMIRAEGQQITARKCWWRTDEKHLAPAFEMTFIDQDRPDKSLNVVANDKAIFASSPLGMDATGTAQLRIEGTLGTIQPLTLDDLDESGFLRGKAFRSAATGSIPAIQSKNYNFAVDDTDGRFTEVSVYGNAQESLKWFRNLTNGAVDEHCFPIDLEVHVQFEKVGPNNASYTPAGQTTLGRPKIQVGDGDGVILKNLGTDPEVVAHEFGHHIVYRAIKDPYHFESRVIHEGMADFFSMARFGNSCLGESVCPNGSMVCQIENQCLRTADNDLKFSKQNSESMSIHSRSQFISGLLWDVGESYPGGLNTWARTVVRSIDHLLPATAYEDLVSGLMIADRELTGGKNACKIYDAAIARGLEPRLKGQDCNAYRSK